MNKLIKTFLYIESKKLIRNIFGIFFGLILFSLIFILISFGIESSLNYFEYGEFLIPGALAFMLAIFSISKGQQIYDEKKKLLREVMSFSFNKKQIFISKIISNSFSLLILSIPAIIIFSIYLKTVPKILITLTGVLITIFLFQGIGIILSISTKKEMINVLKTAIVIFLYFFSEIFFSIKGLGIFSNIKLINPLYYIGDLFRYAYNQNSQVPISINLLVLLIMSILLVFIGEKVFEKSQEYD